MKINITEKKGEIIETIEKLTQPLVIENVEERLDKHFKGFGGKADVEKIYSFIFDLLYENELVNAVDWKWRIQDELSAIKAKVDNFEYEIVKIDEDDDFKVTGLIKVNDKEYELAACSEYEFFSEINEILEDINSPKKVLIIEGLTGDTLYCCIIEEANYYDLTDSEFLPFAYF